MRTAAERAQRLAELTQQRAERDARRRDARRQATKDASAKAMLKLLLRDANKTAKSKEGASKGGRRKSDKYKQCRPQWEVEFNRLKASNPKLSNERICKLIADNHNEAHKDSLDLETVKKVTAKTIRRHILGSSS
jgi:hypothetical protein